MLRRHTLRSATPDEALELCRMNNNCSVHSHMSCVDADNSYAGSWSLTLWDDLILSRTDGIGLNYERHGSHIRDDVNDSIFLHFNLGSGAVAGRHLGRDYVLRPGDGGLFVHNEPVAVGLHKGASLLGLALPRDATRHWKVAPEDVAGREIPTDGFAFDMLRQYLEFLSQSATLTVGAAHVARSHMADLAGLWLGGIRDKDDRLPRTKQAIRALSVRAYIANHFADPNLTVSSVARCVGLSARLVQQVLMEDGVTFSELLADARLGHAAACLKQGTAREKPTIEVAFDCGFNDLSTFYKAFSARYGMSPGSFRKLSIAKRGGGHPDGPWQS